MNQELHTLEEIHDNRGYRYDVLFAATENLWVFKVCFDGHPVGWLNATLSDEVIFLRDIVFETNVPAPEHAVEKLIRRILRREPRMVDYRHRGLGDELLSLFVDMAGSDGFTSIVGNITDDDLSKNPNLPDWYRKHGFTVDTGTLMISKVLGVPGS